MNTLLIKKLETLIQALEISGIALLLLMAYVFQFVFHELPCPLCLLQRVGFIGIACGFLLNLRFGFKPSHYAIILLFSFFTAIVALRQVALHILPGDSGYGSAIFGLHMYTWSFIVSVLILIFNSIILGFDGQYAIEREKIMVKRKWIMHLLLLLIAAILVNNIVSVYFECGFMQCADNPVSYVAL
ncbi:MAG: disulfide bond formation protein B [Pseudomonadota bacterium]